MADENGTQRWLLPVIVAGGITGLGALYSQVVENQARLEGIRREQILVTDAVKKIGAKQDQVREQFIAQLGERITRLEENTKDRYTASEAGLVNQYVIERLNGLERYCGPKGGH